MATRILSCSCPHSFQDERYGQGRRVFNKTGSTPPAWRCTVCDKEHKTDIEAKKAKK